ncbi:hypothetical protein ANABIO32_27340 [Rossellomorea marisflavi]|nr:hypothetical protein ANABIO32_27340 [Rossellomorea marisflavi]
MAFLISTAYDLEPQAPEAGHEEKRKRPKKEKAPGQRPGADDSRKGSIKKAVFFKKKLVG